MTELTPLVALAVFVFVFAVSLWPIVVLFPSLNRRNWPRWRLILVLTPNATVSVAAARHALAGEPAYWALAVFSAFIAAFLYVLLRPLNPTPGAAL